MLSCHVVLLKNIIVNLRDTTTSEQNNQFKCFTELVKKHCSQPLAAHLICYFQEKGAVYLYSSAKYISM